MFRSLMYEYIQTCDNTNVKMYFSCTPTKQPIVVNLRFFHISFIYIFWQLRNPTSPLSVKHCSLMCAQSKKSQQCFVSYGLILLISRLPMQSCGPSIVLPQTLKHNRNFTMKHKRFSVKMVKSTLRTSPN